MSADVFLEIRTKLGVYVFPAPSMVFYSPHGRFLVVRARDGAEKVFRGVSQDMWALLDESLYPGSAVLVDLVEGKVERIRY